MATYVWIDGFEHATLSGSGGGIYNQVFTTPSMSTNPKRTGTYAVAFSGATATFIKPPSVAWSGKTILVGTFHVRISAGPTNGRNIAEWSNTTDSTFGNIRITSGRVIQVRMASAESFVSGPTLSVDTWYRIDFLYDVSSSSWTLDWKVNGSAQTQATHTASGAGSFGYFAFGMIETVGSETATVYFDDFALSNTSGDYPLNGGDDITIYGFSPNAVGTHNLDASPSSFFFDSVSGALTTAETASFGRIDDVPLGGNSDYIYATGTPGSTQYAEYQFANSSVGYQPVAVRIVEGAQQATAGGSVYTSKVTDDGGASLTTLSSAYDPNNASEEFISKVLNSPPSGGSWTEDKLNSLVFRWGHTADATPEIRLTGVMAEAMYGTTASQTPPYANVTIR